MVPKKNFCQFCIFSATHAVSAEGLTQTPQTCSHMLYFLLHIFYLGFFEMKLLGLNARSKAELKMEGLFTGWDYHPVGTAKKLISFH